MKIEFVEIQNFRKLKCCKVDFTDQTTVFVGSNNSGKTSAMDALIYFLGNNSAISTTDFTLSNWIALNEIGKRWIANSENPEKEISISEWTPQLPSLDVWLNASDKEVHYVSHLIPTLDWEAGLLGVRFRLTPTKIEKLYKDFREAFNQADVTNKKSGGDLSLWPRSLRDFLDKRLKSYFGIEAFLLDPKSYVQPTDGIPSPQPIADGTPKLEGDPFRGLVKVSIINAQRGFSDPYTHGDDVNDAKKHRGNISSQVKDYYTNHLNPSELPDAEDVGALQAIKQAQDAFDKKLKDGLTSALSELQNLGYPGFTDPRITISCRVDPLDALNHSSSVQFDVIKDSEGAHESLRLPEKYNGLGYQNLISMAFKLIRFRDEWMQVGKVEKRLATQEDEFFVEPLHLVLIEEPEAHLHAQVQQVFIRKAYGVLRNHKNLKESKQFSTQLVVSTHSSHIAHEIEFSSLRYFKRAPAKENGDVSCVTVVNLSGTFGEGDDTARFATRYLKTTHCDVFFADAVILVEGSGERILMPHFIKTHFNKLSEGYVSLLEVGGSHAHRLRNLIETLGIITLVVTDLDSIDPSNNRKSTQPAVGKGFLSGNSTLKTWLPKMEKLDELVDLASAKKEQQSAPTRVAYQVSKSINFKGTEGKVIPYTFEDALVYENMESISQLTGAGMLGAFRDAISNSADLEELTRSCYEALQKGAKAAFALDILYQKAPEALKVPSYIDEGLTWLQNRLIAAQQELVTSATAAAEGISRSKEIVLERTPNG